MHSPGMVNLPVFFTSAVARVAKSSSSFPTAFLSRPLFAAKESVRPLLVIAGADFFIDFMAVMAFMAFMAFTIFQMDLKSKCLTLVL